VTYDILVLGLLPNVPVPLLSLTTALGGLPDSPGDVTGIYKLAQRWMITFCTALGSMPYQSTSGSSFPEDVQQGQVLTEADAMSFFALAAVDVANQLVQAQLPTDTPDEILSGATLIQVGLGDPPTLTVQIQSQTSLVDVTFIVPG
jgi:hypothetical protein